MESIKIGTQTYELVADGYQLQQEGGRIIFQPGEKTFEEIEACGICSDITRASGRDRGATCIPH